MTRRLSAKQHGLPGRRHARQIASERARGLPTAVSLLQIAVMSGAGPREALASLAELPVQPGPLRRIIDDVGPAYEATALGAGLDDAILASSVTMSPSTLRILEVLRRAEIDGSPLALHLEVLVNELRRDRAAELDLVAQRLTISMLFPLVLCILPAFVLLAIVPLLQSALQGLPL